MSRSCFLFAFILLRFSCIAQDVTSVNLFNELRAAREDSDKVRVLVSLGNFHWNNGRNKDSIIMYADKARKLSKAIRFNSGYNDASYLLCRIYAFNSQITKATGLLNDVPKEEQVRFLIAIGEHYLFMLDREKHNLDSAFYYFNDAFQISRSIFYEWGKHESLIALGKYYFSVGQFQKAKDCFLEIITDLQRSGNRAKEAHIWSELGLYMPDTDSTYADQLWAHGNSARIYHELKDTANEVYVLEDIAGINMYHTNFDQAKSQFLHAIQLRKLAGIKDFTKDYFCLSWICHATGNLNEALSWALEVEKNLKALNIPDTMMIYILLGQIYGDNGQPEKSLQYLLKAQNIGDNWGYFVCSKVVQQYLRLDQPQKALLFLSEKEKKTPPLRIMDREVVAAMKGDCYDALNIPESAEKYYLQMIQLDEEAQKKKSREITPLFASISGSEAYYKIAKFYESQRKYNIAGPYANRALQFNSFAGNHFYTSHLMRNIWWLKFKIDSASGNYLAAIQHYEKYTALNDSIFNTAKSNQLLQLQVQHETERKEMEIEARDTRIQVLTQNDLLRQANLKQAHSIRNITIAALLIVLILGTVLYKQYIQKQRSNKLITQKNVQLQHLLTEKEWLLKEVHHRVKNNLHTVICLLESQAAYLESEALKANETSQRRIYTMSLIHQKIYQSEDIKTIDMAVYLPELIQYLEESSINGQPIHFEVNIGHIHLDISQAVPIALIINEAVTNSLKYAFPGNARGVIRITMCRENDQVRLVIADDGIGIDRALLTGSLDSLGLQLIKGLSHEIKASLRFDNDEGTRITILFDLNPLNDDDYDLDVLKELKMAM